jgi:hypothetical protein
MRIDAICCCVGPKYHGFLKASRQRWLQGLDSLTFNKGAALNLAWHAMIRRSPNPEFLLHFDADIQPPLGWRDTVQHRRPREGFLYGARRFSEAGKPLDESMFFAYGFFQLWHARDPRTWHWPMFEPWHGHAGNYDAEFAERWRRQHVELNLHLTHFDEPRRSWFGPGAPEGEMDRLRASAGGNLYHVRLAARRPENRLPVPAPMLRLHLPRRCHADWAQRVIAWAASFGPFAVKVQADSFPGSVQVNNEVQLNQLARDVGRNLRDLDSAQGWARECELLEA